MERIPYGKYTKEFRQEAVKLVIEGGLSIPEAGRRLSLAPSTLSHWVKTFKAGKLAAIGKTHRPLSDREMEIAKLKRELAEVKMECDILKKAAAYFAKESQRGAR
ncbi:MAG: transposase [Nitrospirae bacterium]|nr:transposase [Nitrospirota bacterium]